MPAPLQRLRSRRRRRRLWRAGGRRRRKAMAPAGRQAGRKRWSVETLLDAGAWKTCSSSSRTGCRGQSRRGRVHRSGPAGEPATGGDDRAPPRSVQRSRRPRRPNRRTTSVLIHDAARPLLTHAVHPGPSWLVAIQAGADGALPVLPVADSNASAGLDGVFRPRPLIAPTCGAPRHPQAFRLSTLRDVSTPPGPTGPQIRSATDDAGVLEHAGGGRVRIWSDGDACLMKLTYP